MPNPIPMGPCPVCHDNDPANMTCPNNPPNSCGGPAANCPWCLVKSSIAQPLNLRVRAANDILAYVRHLENEIAELKKDKPDRS